MYLHAAAIYSLTLQKKTSSLIIGWTIGILSALGTTVGAHRKIDEEYLQYYLLTYIIIERPLHASNIQSKFENAGDACDYADASSAK